ncbi:MAG: redoxin domain-containing protein [Jiangellaceae bacterium]
MRRRALALAAFSVFPVMALVGCGGDDEPAAEPTVDPPPTAAPATSEPAAPAPPPTSAGPEPVPEVLDFTAATVDGATFDGASLAGRPVVVWFWAPWCPVCKAGAADVTAAAAELGDDVAFVGVAGLSGNIDDMQSFVEDTDSASIPHVADVDGAVFTRFEVAQQDTFAFVSVDGAVELVDGYSSDPDLVGIARERFGL